MPADTSRHTIARQWELLRLLPTRGVGKTAKALAETLNDLGYTVSKRQVERDLGLLMDVFPIDCNNTSIPYGWRWVRGASPDIPGLTLAEALSVNIIQDTLRPLLPASIVDVMTPRFEQARKQLQALQKSHRTAQWPRKVKTVPPTLPLVPPTIPDEVLEAVHEALLEDRQLQITYLSASSDTPSEQVLHPLGLINRGAVTYLLATAFEYTDPRLYALHRIHKATMLKEKANTLDGFDLDGYTRSGALQFQWETGKTLRMKARVAPSLARILLETPLAVDQTLKQDGEKYKISATVSESWQLYWWILSQSTDIEILGPKSLRVAIREQVAATYTMYFDDE